MLTIVWDIDDVLNDLLWAWFNHAWLPAHPTSELAYSDLKVNPPHSVLGMTEEAYLASLDEFRVSDAARCMRPVPEVLEWFREHGNEFHHIALTARPLASAPAAAEWMLRHFSAYIRVFGVVPVRMRNNEPVYDMDKAGFLSRLGCADVLVDDSQANVIAATHLGMRGVLYPRPWNDSGLSAAEALRDLTDLITGRSRVA